MTGFGLVVVLANAWSSQAAEPESTARPDCGVNALFVLLHLEGLPVPLDHVKSVLPPRHPDGYSMAELAAAAEALGLGLEGMRFAEGDKAPARPVIAFLRDARGGHFAVLRPVGTTGTMVQVIDPPSAPWITDYDRVFSVRQWPGRVLVARDPWFVRKIAPLMIVTAGLAVIAYALRHRVGIAASSQERREAEAATAQG